MIGKQTTSWRFSIAGAAEGPETAARAGSGPAQSAGGLPRTFRATFFAASVARLALRRALQYRCAVFQSRDVWIRLSSWRDSAA
jgi:hypothetical protein